MFFKRNILILHSFQFSTLRFINFYVVCIFEKKKKNESYSCLFIFKVVREEPQMMVFTIPIFEPLPSQYYVKVVSDRWIGSTNVFPISFQHLILPEKHPPHTSEFLAFILFNTHLSRNMKKLNKVFNH